MPTINIDETNAGRLKVEFTAVADGSGAQLGGARITAAQMTGGTFAVSWAYNGVRQVANIPTVSEVDPVNMAGLFTLNIAQAVVASANGAVDQDHLVIFVDNNNGSGEKMIGREVRVELSGYQIQLAALLGAVPASVWNRLLEGSHTAADLVRLLTGFAAGAVTDFTTGTNVFKSLDGAKTRYTSVESTTGRATPTLGDLT